MVKKETQGCRKNEINKNKGKSCKMLRIDTRK